MRGRKTKKPKKDSQLAEKQNFVDKLLEIGFND